MSKEDKMTEKKMEKPVAQKFQFVLNERGLVEKVPIEGKATGLKDCLVNDLVTFIRPFSLKEKQALILLAKEMNEERVAKETQDKAAKKALKDAAKQAKEAKE